MNKKQQKLFKQLSEPLKNVLIDYGFVEGRMERQQVNEDFDPSHPYFSVSYWGNGQILESHPDEQSVKNLVCESQTRGYDDSFDFDLFDKNGRGIRAKIKIVVSLETKES